MLGKIIKKILKWFSVLVIALSLLPVLAIGVLRIPSVQDKAVQHALEWIGNELGTEIHYSEIVIPALNRITFSDFFLADSRADTLIYAEKANITTPVLLSMLLNDPSRRETIRRLKFENAKLNFVIDSENVLNFRYIIDYLKSNKKEDKEKKPFRIRKIVISNSRYTMLNKTSVPKKSGIDFGYLRTTNFNLKVSDLIVENDTINMRIENLAFNDSSGFVLRELKGDMTLSKTILQFTDVQIITEQSAIDASILKFQFHSFEEFKPNTLFTHVKTQFSFNESSLVFNDIGYFTPVFQNYNQKMSFSGKFSGMLSNFKGKELKLGWGEQSLLEGKFSINGLPDINETFLVFDLNNLSTNSGELNKLQLPGNKKVNLPGQFNTITNINYKGNFTGFLNDFVAHGKLSTNLGVISTDIMISPDTINSAILSGNIGTTNFKIGELLNNELLGLITLSAGINGVISKDNPISANILGQIDKFNLRDYEYSDITINGQLSDKLFNGQLSVNDKNLSMEFEGLIDLASEVRKYDFNLNVIDANLFELNISDSDPEYHASFLLQANAEGKGLDDLNGEFRLLNSLFTKVDKQIQMYDLGLEIQNSDSANSLSIQSELVDAEISGRYKFTEMKPVVIMYLKTFMPDFISDTNSYSVVSSDTRVRFNFNLKYTQSIFDFFFPQYYFAENSIVKGEFLPNKDNFLQLTVISPRVKYKKNEWNGFVMNINSGKSELFTTLGCQNFNFQNMGFENFTLEAKTNNNVVAFKTRWSNWDSTLYKGALSGQVQLKRNNTYPELNIAVNPAAITISDSVWYIDKFNLGMDTTGLLVDNFKVWKEDQYVLADGKITDNKSDTLNFIFNNFELENFNVITRKKDLSFKGKLNGKGNLTGSRKNPLFFSALSIANLEINNEPFGNANIHSVWNNKKQSLSLSANAQRGKLTMLNMDGDFYPALDGKMDFDITLNKLKTNIFSPFMKGTFTQIRGYASGELHLSGYSGKPNLAGELFLQKNAFTVDYLNTRYNFTSEVEIANNNFIFNNIELFDKDGNSAVMNGMIRTDYLKDISLNLGISMDNLLCMDTRQIDNESFFGTAYATGEVKIKGNPSTLHFNIDARTDDNTRMFIPLSETTEVSEYSFVQFIRSKSDTTEKEEVDPEQVQKVSLDGIQMDFNLDVTPAAEVQIIFDPTMGDIIKAHGAGSMKLSINTLGSFDMVGEYNIEAGDYLFTLQNLINKKFKIEGGSKLRWTGDPLHADIDITAVYRTKAILPSSDVPVITAESSADVGTETQTKQGRTTVDCRLFLTGDLLTPDIRYDIHLPLAEEETRNRLDRLIQSEEELSKQFLFLMVMNQFKPRDQNIGGLGGNVVGSNATELLSNQFSNWLSQISNDFDLGFTYRPGNEEMLTSDEVEVALSTQLLNDRLSIDGSVDMKSEATVQNVSRFAGDFDVDYKLNEKGKVRIRAFNRSNEDIVTYAPNTQGFGIFFKEDFNTFGELINRYWAVLSGKRNEPKPTTVDENTE